MAFDATNSFINIIDLIEPNFLLKS